MRKEIFSLLKVFAAFLVASNCLAEEVSQEKVIVYNWSDYIPDTVLESFTKETGIKVEYSTYDNNEVMHARLKILRGRGYDVIVPSTYMIKSMAEDGLIQKIDKNKLENFSNLDPALLNQSYDPNNNYSIPYLWGSTGVVLNRDKYKDIRIRKWEDLLDYKLRNKLVMQDDMRDVFSIGLKASGFSINSTSEDEISEAYYYLEKLSSNIKLYSGSPQEDFLSEAVDIGLMWNGDAVAAKESIASLEYIYPEEGVSFWADSFAIPSRAQNANNAHKFIDYMLRPEIAALCTQEMGYATPNLTAKGMLPEETRKNETIFPSPEVVKVSEFQESVNDAYEIYQIYWAKLKTAKRQP